ncbi:cupin domain-containing protein, partial [Escherichia coli]|nr:cupin domain-containing protein [Escherichia coli]
MALEDVPVAEMAADALEQVLARLDTPSSLPVTPQVRNLAAMPDGLVLPSPLKQYDMGKWKFLAPGVQWSSIGRGGAPRNRPMLLRAKPGMVLPEHTHRGVEYTLVLKGTLHDALG